MMVLPITLSAPLPICPWTHSCVCLGVCRAQCLTRSAALWRSVAGFVARGGVFEQLLQPEGFYWTASPGLSRYADHRHPPNKQDFHPCLHLTWHLLLLPLSWLWEMLTGVSPPGCILCSAFQRFLSHLSYLLFQITAPTPLYCSSVQQGAPCFPALVLFLILGMCPPLRTFWNIGVGLQKVILQVWWGAWSQCCGSATWAKAACDVHAPKLWLLKFQDNWHMAALLRQLMMYADFQVTSVFWNYKRCLWPQAVWWKQHNGHLMETEAGEHGPYVPACRRHTCAFVLHLFSAMEY